MTTAPDASAGFIPFFRRYTRTWIHAVATAGLTVCGTLTIFHRGFAVLAVAVYVFPPVVLYITRSGPPDESDTEPIASENESESREEGAMDETDTPSDEPTRATDTESYWTAVDSPTDATLFDVTVTERGAYAVGADGIALADDGDGWQTILTDGPSAASKTLRGVDSTADGGAIWVAGDGGAVARLDSETGRHVDFSLPNGLSDTWEDVAVGGIDDDELVLLVNGSGEVLRGRYRDGEMAWDAPVKPGSGSSLSGVALASDSVGHLCDTNDSVFETTDGGETFRQIGIEAANGTLTDVATTGHGACTVSGDDGVLHRYDDGRWTPVRLGDEALEAVALREEYGVACGGNTVYERATNEAEWERNISSEAGPLVGIAVGSERAVAVGDSGAIVERM